MEMVKNVSLPLPPREEQKEILDCIGKEENRISQRIVKISNELILLKEFRTTLINEVVTGQIDVREVN
jgi:type I restriction enzyme S subunit